MKIQGQKVQGKIQGFMKRLSMPKIWWASLRTKLVLTFLVIALVPLFLTTVITKNITAQVLTQSANQTLWAAASQTALRLDTFLQNTLDEIRVDAQLPELSKYLQRPAIEQSGTTAEAELSAIFRTLTRRDPINVLSYALLNLQGMTIFSTHPPDAQRNRAQEDYFQQALNTKFPFVSSVHVPGSEDGLASLYFSSPVWDASGQIIGVLVMRYNATVIQQMVFQNNDLAGAESFAEVLDEHHIRLAHGAFPDMLYTSPMPLPPEQVQALQQQRLPQKPVAELVTHQPDFEQALNQLNCDLGQVCDSAYATIQMPQGRGRKRVVMTRLQTQSWFVAFCQPEEVFLTPIWAEERLLLGLGVAIAVIVSIAAIATARQLAHPLLLLAKGVDQFTEGDLEAQVQIKSRDEIGLLAENFNGMAAQVGQLLKGLEERTTELESSQYVAYAVSQLAKSMLDVDRLLSEAVKLVQEGFGVDDVQIYLWDEAQDLLRLRARASQWPQESGTNPQVDLNWDWNLLAIAARTGQSQVSHDLSCILEPQRCVSMDAQSELAVPLMTHGTLIGVLDIQDRHSHRFDQQTQEIFNTLAGQIATAIDNAQLFGKLQATEMQYRVKAEELQQALQNLQQAQAQLVQNEKMSSLGQLVAGIAHEINNPINFIYANLTYVNQYQVDLFGLLQLYQIHYPQPLPEVAERVDELDLEFVTRDFSKILTSMKVGADRIRKIVLSLRNFSRLDESEMKQVNIHEGIDSTLVILQNQLKQQGDRPYIQVVKEYGKIPLVECYAGQLNQVFMNLFLNAIDALEARFQQDYLKSLAQVAPTNSMSREDGLHRSQSAPLMIIIRTAQIDDQHVAIHISDNGVGIAAETQKKLFDPFFTTKDVGKGTGLGLSVGYQVVTEKHHGRLYCRSEVGQGTEFVIEIPLRQKA